MVVMMKVRVTRQSLTTQEMKDRQSDSLRSTLYSITTGREYEVIGIYCNEPYYGVGTQCHVVDDDGALTWVPEEMVEVVDPAVRSDWQVRRFDRTVVLGPPELFVPYLHDDLSESDKRAKSVLLGLLSRYGAADELHRVSDRY